MYPEIHHAVATPQTVFGIATAVQMKPSKVWQKLLYLLKRKDIHICDWIEHRPNLIIPVYLRGCAPSKPRPVTRSTELPKREKEERIAELLREKRLLSPIELTLYTGFSKPTITQLCGGMLSDGQIILVEVVDREHYYGLNTPENQQIVQPIKPRKSYRYAKEQNVFKKIDQQNAQLIERAFEAVLRPA